PRTRREEQPGTTHNLDRFAGVGWFALVGGGVTGAVGFIGLGQIGGPMAARLVDWPGGLVVYDVRPEAADPHVANRATLAASIGELAAACDVVSVMVLDDDQVRSVVAELLPAARPGTAVVVHSTIRPETAEQLAV